MLVIPRSTRSVIVLLLLTLPLLQGCDDDNAEPAAHHVKVKVVQLGCGWKTLQILNPRYAAMGQKNFCAWYGCITGVTVDFKKNPAFFDQLKLEEIYYVDMKRDPSRSFYVCALAPGPEAEVLILKIH